ncbi:MAG: PilZ domain-containing protein [Myxococcales bacterium]|nr:PilZ domain-containing protein [Myxococcales bacterium]MCB9709407.1 PilZ domain-containing protein [Myxococcales bacterium]
MSQKGPVPGHAGRRRRFDRPLSLWLFGGALLLSPIVNYFAIVLHYGLPFTAVEAAFQMLSPISGLLLVLPFPLAIGILGVRRWAWWLFLGYAPLLVAHNLYALVREASLFNIQALAGAAFGTVLMVYFLRRDVFSPFLHTGKRGWRRARRKPMVIDMQINDTMVKTKDISTSGAFAAWPGCPYPVNSALDVVLHLPQGSLRLEAGLVHVGPDGAGLAFRHVSEDAKRALERAIQQGR